MRGAHSGRGIPSCISEAGKRVSARQRCDAQADREPHQVRHEMKSNMETDIKPSAPNSRSWQIFPACGSSKAELDAAVATLERALLQHGGAAALADASLAFQADADSSPLRCALIVDSAECAAWVPDQRYRLDDRVRPGASDVAFMFAGVGEQYVGMAERLYATERIFKAVLDDCASRLEAQGGLQLLSKLYPPGLPPRRTEMATKPGAIDLRAMLRRDEPADQRVEHAKATDFAHPALFSVEYALAKLWMSWGIEPAAMIGHSLGEYVAACISGVLSIDDALRVVSERARLIGRVEAGGMWGVALAADDLAPLLPAGISISAINAPGLSVVAGELGRLEMLGAALTARGVAHRAVNAGHAFHSVLMEPLRADIEDLFREVTLHVPAIPYVSNLTGDWIRADDATNPRYWARHSCETVLFGAGVETLHAAGFANFLEIGPGHVLASFVRQQLACVDPQALCVVQSVPAAREDVPDDFTIARSLATLWCRGVLTDWTAYAGVVEGSKGVAGRDAAPEAWHQDPAADPADEGVAAPVGELEEMLAQLWCEALNRSRVGRMDNFFRLGGNSLLGMKLITRLRNNFSLELPIRTLFQFPVLADFAEVVESMLLADLGDAAPGNGPGRVDASGFVADPTATSVILPNGLNVLQFNRGETDHFYHDIFDGHVYARNGIVIEHDAVIFDVGANIGLFSLYASTRGKNAQIYAFEPAPPVFALLCRNLEPIGSRARLFNVGVADKPGRASLTYYPLSTGMSSFHADLAEEKKALDAIIRNQSAQSEAGLDEVMSSVDELLELRLASRTFECEVLTISDVIERYGIERIDLMKIDVQKSEAAVLAGIADRHWPLVRQIVVETHDIDGRLKEVAEKLERAGFVVTHEQDELYRGSNIYNVYASRQDDQSSRN